MANTIENTDNQQIIEILQSNSTIKKSTLKTIQEYLTLQNQLFGRLSRIIEKLNTVKEVANIFLSEEQCKFLDEFKPNEKVQLAICGYNSTGKTTFVHYILGCGNFLPSGVGAVSARIVKFSFSTANEACLIKNTSELDSEEQEEKVDLSSYFTSPMTKANAKVLRETVTKYVARPNIDQRSDAFAKWASHLIEMRIPSSFLKLGIDIYDTPGFLGNDPPILAENLLKLVGSIRPSLIYLYDNPTVSDDSRKSFEQLQLALRCHCQGTAVFFLNTKADVLTIRNDTDDDSDEITADTDDRLLNHEREKRYQLLLQVNEMSNALSDGQQLPLDQCDRFDIFSSQGSTDPMESKMKTHAINSIIQFAAKHDLRSTKQVIKILLGTIDNFFDFVLITNRRSPGEWEKMRDYALQWIDEYFATYQSQIGDIANEATNRIPAVFRAKCDEIEKRAVPHCETTWWERMYIYGIPSDVFGLISSSPVIEYINMVVEKEVIKPVLDEITSKISKKEKAKIDQNKLASHSIKNELLMAAYRAVMIDQKDYGSLHSQSSMGIGRSIGLAVATPFILLAGFLGYGLHAYVSILTKRNNRRAKIQNIEIKRKVDIQQHLLEIEPNLATMGEQIKVNMQKWLENSRTEFIRKVNDYYQLVCDTLAQRQTAYDMAREFAPLLARIECCLVANLNSADHRGSTLTIDEHIVLGMGGYFTIHPATWGSEENIVAKKLIRPIEDQEIAFIEAHFHRTVTRLQIPHMVPLRYFYEIVKDPQQFIIVLPRYSKNLRSYLINQMQHIIIDKAVQISLDIARAVTLMHSYDLVHRDIKVENILLDTNDQVFLADFGTCQHGVENSTFIGIRPFVPELTTADHQYSYQGSAFDVFCLGIVMYVVAPKNDFHQPRTLIEADVNSLDRTRVPDKYCNLIINFINKEPKERPTTIQIVEELQAIANQISDSESCLVCMNAARTARCLSCQHKTMCSMCLAAARKSDKELVCILCREIFTDIEWDTDANTFLALPS